MDTVFHGSGQFGLLSHSLDSAHDSPFPCFSRSSPFSPFQAARFHMALPSFVFLLVVCLLLPLARLGRHVWLHLRPSSRGGAKRGTLHHRLSPHSPDDCPACHLASTPSLVAGLARRTWVTSQPSWN